MTHRTRVEAQAAQAEFIHSRTDVITRYQDGESTASLAHAVQAGHAWIAERLDEWDVSRR
ncbi:hypothetical protein [Streptomyces sp. NPDC006012]|uniref:hypothetical protein n=1 Tax=Streptomyces sp. NPDC006012 TaxID=3364739 RepID=UPI0036AE3A69